MGNSAARLFIEKEMLDLQLNLENNYKDNAYESYLNVLGMLESFYEQKEISKWRFKRYKRQMKRYDDIYNMEEPEKVVD